MLPASVQVNLTKSACSTCAKSPDGSPCPTPASLDQQPLHLLAVHLEILPIDLNLDYDNLVVPFLPDRRVPDVAPVESLVDAPNDL